MLDVDVQLDAGEARPRQMREGVRQSHVPAPTGVEDGVGEHELAVPRSHVELDHVDADLARGVERGERVRGGERAGAAVPDPLA